MVETFLSFPNLFFKKFIIKRMNTNAQIVAQSLKFNIWKNNNKKQK